MNRRSTLSPAKRRAFSLLIRQAREKSPHKGRRSLALAVADRLSPDSPTPGPSPAWIRNLEEDPPRPLSNVVWLDALMQELDISVEQLWDALGLRY